jgi:ubiquinone biosynthesis protein COQ9
MARPLLRPLRSCRNSGLHSFCRSPRISLIPAKSAVPNQLRQPSRDLPSHQHRLYHSQHHPDPPPHEYTNSQTTILTAALRHVPTHGFTRDALTLGARDTGFLDVSIQLLPRGEFDLILFWLASRRGLLRAAVEQNGLLKPTDSNLVSVEEKTRKLIMERLRMNTEIKHQWQDVRLSPPQKQEDRY